MTSTTDYTQATCVVEASDPESFFPVGDGAVARQQTSEALAVCARCPLQVECLFDALDQRSVDGVRGGRTGHQRYELLAARGHVAEVELDSCLECGCEIGFGRAVAIPAGVRRHAGRGLCWPCHRHLTATGELDQYRPLLSRTERREQVRYLADHGRAPAEIAAELGVPRGVVYDDLKAA